MHALPHPGLDARVFIPLTGNRDRLYTGNRFHRNTQQGNTHAMTRFRDPSQGLTVHRLALAARHIDVAAAALVERSDLIETALSLRTGGVVPQRNDFNDEPAALGAH